MLRVSLLAGVVMVATSWLVEEQWGSDLPAYQRERNLDHFLKDIVPYPVRKNDDWGEFMPWLNERLFEKKGLDAVHRTFHLGTSAVLLAAGIMLVALPFSSRAMAGEKMFGVWQGASRLTWLRKLGGKVARAWAMVGRSIPEYILAFLLLQIFGQSAWALILALAIHNAGILVRLGGEVMENHRCPGAEVAAATGASRAGAYSGSWLACAFNRMLMFVFYRWETCIREATILGMLGVASLGFLIDNAKTSLFYDDLLLYVVLGAMLVMIGDVVSDVIRRRLKR